MASLAWLLRAVDAGNQRTAQDFGVGNSPRPRGSEMLLAGVGGTGVEVDAAEAFRWICMAAEAGNAQVQFGVPADAAQAMACLRKVAGAGNKDATRKLAEFETSG